MLQIITIVLLFLVACTAWVLWTEAKSKQALDRDALEQAWRNGMNDPNCTERRHYEERKRVVDQAHSKIGASPL